MNIGPTITFYLKMPDKNSSSSQILRCCAQWENRLDSLPAHVGPDTLTTRQHHRPTPMPPRAAIMDCGQLYHVYGGICVWKIRANTRPANTRHSPNAVSMVVHRLRRWPNIKTASGECLVLLGRVVLARCALPPVCAARRESANSHDSRPTQLQITPQVGL